MEKTELKLFKDAEKAGMFVVGQRNQNVFHGFLNLAHEVMHEEYALSPLIKELVGAYVSKQFGCSFCHLGHLETAIVFGGEEVKSLVDNPSDELKILFELADKIANNQVKEQDVIKFLESGHSEKEYEDLVFVTSLFGFANRMVKGFGIEYVQSRDEKSSRYLAKGYRLN